MEPLIEIVDYKPEYAEAFRDLNLAWIAAAHEVEEDDIRMLSDPQKSLLNDGGVIIIALCDGKPVGTCALRKVNDAPYEMTKMTVASGMRGRSIGRLLCEAIINRAKQMSLPVIELYSNRTGSAAAINMYRKMGFVEVPLGSAVYKRADIKMRLDLSDYKH